MYIIKVIIELTNECNGENGVRVELAINAKLKLIAEYDCKEENNY